MIHLASLRRGFSNQINLQGRTAIVTGAAQGIGLAVANRLVESGVSVSLWDHDRTALETTAATFSNSSFEIVDVTDAKAVEESAASTNKALGAIDILVCSAGISGCNAPTWEYPLEEWQRVMDVNLNGVFNCNRAVMPYMLEQKYGRVVNVASIAGKEGNPNASAYSASKAGVIALTKSLAKETADLEGGGSIAVNCITPAAARTRIFDQMSQAHIDYMLSKIPRNRFLDVNEVASMVAWLCSEENSFTTGSAFDLSGGRATY